MYFSNISAWVLITEEYFPFITLICKSVMKSLNDFCHCVHLLWISTFKFIYLINCYATWSFSSWLKQVMVTWVQPRHQGSLSIPCTFVHFSFIQRVPLSTSGKCLVIWFSDVIRIWLFTFVKCPPQRFSCFFNIFWYFAYRGLFGYFSTPYSFSFLSCLPSYQRSLSVLWFTYFPFFHHCLWLYTDLSLTVLLYCFDLHCLPLPFH